MDHDYITYEFAADYLGIRVRDLEWFLIISGFPKKNYRMVHKSILQRYPR